MSTTLRLIHDSAHSATFNMAADLYLLETIPADTVIVRLYTWEHPTITLGYMEDPLLVLDHAALKRDGVEWVRRATGGRAVLHAGDITYSCVFPSTLTAMGSSISESYQIISDCLMDGLKQCGIVCTTHDSALDIDAVRTNLKLPCFLAPNRQEIMVAGKKLVGSAQKRTDTAVLQHGSIPITAQFVNLPDYLTIDDDQKKRFKKLLIDKGTCINDICPALSFDQIKKYLLDGFHGRLAFVVEYRPWTERELLLIEQRAGEKTFIERWCR